MRPGKSAAASREVPLEPRAEGAIRSYLLGRGSACRDRDREPLFLSEDSIGFSAEHGVEHRAEIKDTLALSGIETPDLDAWFYSPAAGYGREI